MIHRPTATMTARRRRARPSSDRAKASRAFIVVVVVVVVAFASSATTRWSWEARAFETSLPRRRGRRAVAAPSSASVLRRPSRTTIISSWSRVSATRRSSRGDDDDVDATTARASSALSVGLPAASLAFPLVDACARSLPVGSDARLAAVIALFVGSRAYLYALAAVVVVLASRRGAADAPALGRRLADLTEELLFRPDLRATRPDDENDDDDKESRRRRRENEERPALLRAMAADGGLEESLDGVSADSQAVLLPVLASSLLAASALSVSLLSNADGGGDASSSVAALAAIVPAVSRTWNGALLVLFARVEIRRAWAESAPPSVRARFDPAVGAAVVEWAAACAVVAAAYAGEWPARNFVNAALAATVARVVQIDRASALLVALALLVSYDAASVWVLPAFAATDVSSSASAMGSVAASISDSATFVPGLLVCRVKNLPTGSLGLGDAVFPSLLATFVRRFERARETNDDDDGAETPPLSAAVLVGYALGCAACETSPRISTTGLPALVYVVPSMLIALCAIAATREGTLADLWNFDPNAAASERRKRGR